MFELKSLEKKDIDKLLLRAVSDTEKGMGAYGAVLDDDAREFLSDIAGGDARAALNALELAILTTEKSEDGKIHITLEVASECIQKRVVRYDKTGDNHYDTISAFIKSMRGSDPDAAVYYLAKMLYAGEDIKFIARRIMICASEDVGNCRSTGTSSCSFGSSGSRAGWYAGSSDYFIAGSFICSVCAKKQCGIYGGF